MGNLKDFADKASQLIAELEATAEALAATHSSPKIARRVQASGSLLLMARDRVEQAETLLRELHEEELAVDSVGD